MATTERRRARADGRVFRPRAVVMDGADVRRALVRIAHEVIERNHGTEGLVVVGLHAGGVPPARHFVGLLREIAGHEVPFGTLDAALYRDDVTLRPVLPQAATHLDHDLTGKVVVLVDDVLFTGRTVRAALDALADFGRARAVQLAVMVDRGHRELPIRPDFVGKNLPTRLDELVEVSEQGVAIGDLVTP